MAHESMRPYEIVRLIACGGMGSVYEGRARLPFGDSLPVAIKVLHRNWAENEAVGALAPLEARHSLKLCHDHPNLVTTFASHMTADGRPYLVMEYVDGVDLRALVRGEVGDAPRFFALLRRIACDILLALEHLHTHGVIHRDVSPGNVLLGRDGAVKLADMGLSKALDSGRSADFRGTAAYAGPDALNALEPSIYMDLYSLGAVLYERITGHPPFGAGPDGAVFQAMGADSPVLPDTTPGDLAELVCGLLACKPEDRVFHSAWECCERLQERGEPIAGDTDLAALVERLLPRARQMPVSDDVTIPTLYAPSVRPLMRWALCGVVASLMIAVGFAGALMLRPSDPAPDNTSSVHPAPEPPRDVYPVECIIPAPTQAEQTPELPTQPRQSRSGRAPRDPAVRDHRVTTSVSLERW